MKRILIPIGLLSTLAFTAGFVIANEDMKSQLQDEINKPSIVYKEYKEQKKIKTENQNRVKRNPNRNEEKQIVENKINNKNESSENNTIIKSKNNTSDVVNKNIDSNIKSKTETVKKEELIEKEKFYNCPSCGYELEEPVENKGCSHCGYNPNGWYVTCPSCNKKIWTLNGDWECDCQSSSNDEFNLKDEEGEDDLNE